MKTIYVAGNRLLGADSLPLRIMDKLEEKFPFSPSSIQARNTSTLVFKTFSGVTAWMNPRWLICAGNWGGNGLFLRRPA